MRALFCMLLIICSCCGDYVVSYDTCVTKDSGTDYTKCMYCYHTKPDFNYAPACGNKICDIGESIITCPEDCRPRPTNIYHNKELIVDPGFIDPLR